MNVKNSQKLKQLQTRKAKLEVDVSELSSQAKIKQQEHSSALNTLKSVESQISELESSDIVVSEHAILRYLERLMDVNVEDITSQILTKDNVSLIQNLGNGKYPIGNGLKAVVKNNTVVSVV